MPLKANEAPAKRTIRGMKVLSQQEIEDTLNMLQEIKQAKGHPNPSKHSQSEIENFMKLLFRGELPGTSKPTPPKPDPPPPLNPSQVARAVGRSQSSSPVRRRALPKKPEPPPPLDPTQVARAIGRAASFAQGKRPVHPRPPVPPFSPSRSTMGTFTKHQTVENTCDKPLDKSNGRKTNTNARKRNKKPVAGDSGAEEKSQ